MRYDKKIVVLKEIAQGYSVNKKPVSGIVRVEIEDGVANLFLSFVNFCACRRGAYAFYLTDGDGGRFYYDLGVRPASFARVMERLPEIKKGFAAGVCLIEDDLPTLVAFGRSDESEFTVTDIKSVAAEQCLILRKQRLKSAKVAEIPIKKEESTARTIDPAEEIEADRAVRTGGTGITDMTGEANATEDCVYDDEAVATENYYETEGEQDENDGGWFQDKSAYFGGGKGKGAKPSDDCGVQDEDSVMDGEDFSEERPYYLTVKEELNEIFDKFPEETSLKKLFPDSEFSRVNYSADKFYVVGLIREGGREKYICYGVHGAYSENAPAELAPYCSFIPISIFDLAGDGYWMMFQSATTGECILLNQNK